MDTVKEQFLSAFSNILARKRSERLAEEMKIESLMNDCKRDHSSPPKGYSDRLISLNHEIKMLEEGIDTVRKEP